MFSSFINPFFSFSKKAWLWNSEDVLIYSTAAITIRIRVLGRRTFHVRNFVLVNSSLVRRPVWKQQGSPGSPGLVHRAEPSVSHAIGWQGHATQTLKVITLRAKHQRPNQQASGFCQVTSSNPPYCYSSPKIRAKYLNSEK